MHTGQLVRFVIVSLVSVLACPTSLHAQRPDVDGVTLLLGRLEKAVTASGQRELPALLSPLLTPQQVNRLQTEVFASDASRAVVRERDRESLPGALPGDGYRLTVEIFLETARRARVLTVRIDVRRPREGEPESWRIFNAEQRSSVEGLHRLRLGPSTQFAVSNLTIRSEDLQLTLVAGSAFRVDSEDGPTGLVLLGRGEMKFSPAPATEKTQVRIFAGAETLVAPFDAVFIRLNPSDYAARVSANALHVVDVDPQAFRRAQEVFVRESQKSLNIDLRDLSRETWHLLPPAGDFLAEVRTRKFGTLTYALTRAQSEDVTVFDRARRRTIALYASAERLAARGQFYSEDDRRDFDVLDYAIDATLAPQREFISSRARMTIRGQSESVSTLTLHLAETLTIGDIFSPEYGRLLYLRIRNQNSIVVTLPAALQRNAEMTIVVDYSGTVPSQRVDAEGLALSLQGSDDPSLLSEPHFLLSNRSLWYPQGDTNDFVTATMRITVPEGYGCLGSGELASDTPSPRDSAQPSLKTRQYTFTATDPLRYLAVIVSKFQPVGRATLALGEGVSDSGRRGPLLSATGERLPGFRVRDRVDIAVHANPRQQSRGRDQLEWAADIMKFYATLLDDAPYPALNIAMVEQDLPGGHSPAYVVILNNPPPSTPVVWRNDPAAFAGFPEFFMAHELAHQWWGQAVGWKNYHEQWLSEGFAQYFSALYAQKLRGDDAFFDMLRQFRKWALSESDEGPIYLGYRLGHIKGDNRVFRALVYNKAAGVLHMLRRLVGDEVFFAGLRRFYSEQKFQKAGSEDLQRALEAEYGQSLARFFERWIYGSDMPRLRYETVVETGGVTVRFEQRGDLVFDLPVTVTLVYNDGRTEDIVVPVRDKRVEQKIPTKGAVRQVQVNRDSAALAQFDAS